MVGGKFVVAGGRNNKGQYLATVEELDFQTQTWNDLPRMSTERQNFSLAAIGTELFALGGGRGEDMFSCEKYDFESKLWTRIDNLPTFQLYPTVCIVNQDRLLYFARAIYEYNKESNQWIQRRPETSGT